MVTLSSFQPMKILITAPSLNEDENVSGIASLVRGIIARGKNEYVHFAAGRKDGERLGLGWLLRQFRIGPRFQNALSSVKPDVVHLNTSFEPRAIYRDSTLAKIARAYRIPRIVHVHGGRFVLQEFKDRTLDLMAKDILQTATKVIVLSDEERSALLRRTQKPDIEVFPNAVATDEIPFAERTNTEKIILYFGRIDMAKGLKDIVEACRILVDEGTTFKFVCCGTGPAEKYFVTEMQKIMGDRFEHRGVVKGSEKWNALSTADIFLLPSTFEGLPIALLEAMAAGCLPVVTNVGAMADVVEDRVNGFVVGPGNLDQIIDRLKLLLSKNQDELSGMRRAARSVVEARFDMAAYVERLENLYASVAVEK